MATPAIKELKSQFPQTRLGILALKPGIRDLAAPSNWFEKIFYWDPDKTSLLSGLKTLRQIRSEKYHIALGFFPTNHWKFSLFMLLSGAGQRSGFNYPGNKLSNFILKQKMPYVTSQHDVEKNLNLAQKTFALKEAAKVFLIFPREYLTPIPLPGQKYFVCHPGSSAERGMSQKRWPKEQFAILISNIHKEYGLCCVLVGGPEEAVLRHELASQCKEAILDAPAKSLGECAYVISQAQFFLGNDSGLMHVAVSLGKRCIALFGPSDEERTGPYFLEEDKTAALPNRGHLILRSPEDKKMMGQKSSEKLAYEGKSHLHSLKAESVWPEVKAGFLNKHLNTKE